MSGSGSLTSYPFAFSGTLPAGTSDASASFTLPAPAQGIIFEFNTTQKFGGDEYVTLGTNIELAVVSENPGVGFGNLDILSIGYSTYPGTNPPLGPPPSGYATGTITVNSGDPPDGGSGSGSVYVGVYNPMQQLGANFSGTISAQSLTGSDTIQGAISVDTPAVGGSWASTEFPQWSNIDSILGFVVSDSIGIEVDFTITGTAYYGEVLVLNQVNPTYGEEIPLKGANLGSLCETLLVSQDNGSYVSSIGFVPGVNWLCTGAEGITAEYGTHTLQVKDAATGVTSNVVTYYLASSGGGSASGPGGGGGAGAGNAACCALLPSPSLGRYRGACGINFNGLTLIGDAYSGVIGQANFNEFQEYGNVMRALITAPQIHSGRRRVFVPKVEIDVETGVGNAECCGFDPQWLLDWSKDGGRTWGPLQPWRSMGKIGAYGQRLRWLRLGQARQWLFRLQSTDPVRRVVISTFVDWYAGMATIVTEE